MAYSKTLPPVKVADGLAGGPNLWMYQSTDVKATVIAANYITNASDLGMRVGDAVIILDTTSPLSSLAIVSAVATTGSTLV